MAKLSLAEINEIAKTVSFAMGHKNRDTNADDFPYRLASALMVTLYDMNANNHFSAVLQCRNNFIFTATGGSELPENDARVATPELSEAFWQLAAENNEPAGLLAVKERADLIRQARERVAADLREMPA